MTLFWVEGYFRAMEWSKDICEIFEIYLIRLFELIGNCFKICEVLRFGFQTFELWLFDVKVYSFQKGNRKIQRQTKKEIKRQRQTERDRQTDRKRQTERDIDAE